LKKFLADFPGIFRLLTPCLFFKEAGTEKLELSVSRKI
jgi:hypothetical protein